MIKILLVDDHQMFLDGLASILRDEEDIEIIQEVPDGELALKVLKNNPVDVVILDYEMPYINGYLTTKEIKKKYPQCKVLILSMHNDKTIIKNLIEVGVSGFILKNSGKKELIRAIRAITDDKKYFSEKITEILISDIAESKNQEKQEKVHITKREKEVLKLVVEGYTSKQIANELFIAETTVETHRSNLLSKTGMPNARALVNYAHKNKLLE